MEIQKLSDMAVGVTCIITNISNNSQDSEDKIFLKMMELGILQGEYLTILHKCSKSGPICIQIHGHQSNISLRMDEADKIEVKLVSNNK